MTDQETVLFRKNFDAAVKAAVAGAIDRHRRLGESIAVWRDEQVVILGPDQIPPVQSEAASDSPVHKSTTINKTQPLKG